MAVVACGVVVLGVVVSPAQATEDLWQPGFHAAGPDGRVTALGTWRGQLVAAGAFTAMGGVSARGIAAWDGATWRALGEGVGVPDPVQPAAVLFEFDGDLLVGGTALSAAGLPSSPVLRWDGHAWSDMGLGLDGGVDDLLLFQGQLYAAGRFSTSVPDSSGVLARWTGGAWQVLTGGARTPPLSEAHGLVAFHDTLFVGGHPMPRTGPFPPPLCRWTGDALVEVPGVRGELNDLAVFAGRLFVGGRVALGDTYSPQQVAAWDGRSWSIPAGGVRQIPPDSDFSIVRSTEALRVIAGRLVVTGSFDSAGTQAAGSLATFDGERWEAWPLAVGRGAFEVGRALAEFDGRLVVGGDIGPESHTGVVYLVQWDGSTWAPLGTTGAGSGRGVTALARWRGRLLAGGTFEAPSGPLVRGLAERVGEAWQPFVPAPGETLRLANVEVLLPLGDSLLVSGVEGYTSRGAARRAVLWDGAGARTVSTSLGSFFPDIVALWRGHPVAVVEGAVRWNDHLIGTADGAVFAVGTFHDRLIVGGNFRHIDDQEIGFIASWDGTGWRPLNWGPGGTVTCLQVHDGELVVGGVFQEADGQFVNSVARWNGARWAPMGNGFGLTPPDNPGPWDDRVARVEALVPWGERLVALGHFDHAGGLPADNVAVWDGLFWHPLGAGLAGSPLAAVADDAGLWVGGALHRAGAYPAVGLARWLGPAPGGASPVTGLTAVPAADGSGVEVRWSTVRLDGIQGFDLERRLNDAEWQSVEAEPQPPRLGETRVLDAGVRPGPFERVRYRVILRRLGGDRFVTPGEAELAWPLAPPAALLLGAGSPNPFTTSTTIPFALPAAGDVRLEVFDVSGRQVATLVAGRLEAGLHRVTWDGRTESGRSAAAGVYLVRLAAAGADLSRRVVRGGPAR